MLSCLVITTPPSHSDKQVRESINNCETDRKLAKTTTMLTAALRLYSKHYQHLYYQHIPYKGFHMHMICTLSVSMLSLSVDGACTATGLTS